MARRRDNKDSWHFCRNCSNWPTSGYVEGDEDSGGEKCNECLAKRKANNCTPS